MTVLHLRYTLCSCLLYYTKHIKDLVKKVESDLIYWGMLQYCLRYVVFNRTAVPTIRGSILIHFTQSSQIHQAIHTPSLNMMPGDGRCRLELRVLGTKQLHIH